MKLVFVALTLTFFSIVPAFLCSAAVPSTTLINRNGILYMPVTVEDQKGKTTEAFLILDSGSYRTMVDISRFPTDSFIEEKAEITVRTVGGYKTINSQAIIPRIEVATKDFRQVRAPVIDFGIEPLEIDTGNGKRTPVIGILGADILYSSSFFLSVVQSQFSWTEEPPWHADSTIELHSLPGKMWAVSNPSPTPNDSYDFLIDTGTFYDIVPIEALSSWQQSSPLDWIQIEQKGISQTAGILTSAHPFLPSLAASRHSMGIPGAGRHNIGTETMSFFDLWFHIQDYRIPELSIRRTKSTDQKAFLDSIDYSYWKFYETAFGFTVDSTTGEVIQLLKWGDGRPFVEGLQLGDVLLSIDGIDYGNSGIQRIPQSNGKPVAFVPVTFRWKQKDGHELVATLRKMTVFSKKG